MPAKLKSGRRPDIEADLADKYHVGWEYHERLPVDEFDLDASLANQARFEAIDDATVEQYTEAVRRGDLFPAVIAYRRRKNGKLIIIDGNHRLVAHSRANAHLDAYVIEQGTRPQVIQLMTYAFNTRHGRPTGEAERVQQAFYLIDNGASMGDAAQAVNVPDRILKRELAKRKADARAKEIGVDMREWDALSQSAKSRLLNISTDEGLRDAVHLAFAASLDANEVFDLVGLLNTSKSATKQRAIVKAETDRHRDRIQSLAGGLLDSKSNRRAITPKARVGLAVSHIVALPEDFSGIAAMYGEAEREEQAHAFLTASERLRKLAMTLDPSAK